MLTDDDKGERIPVCILARLAHLVPPFLQRRENELKQLRRALAADDYETVRMLGHNLSSSAGGLGFKALSEIAADIESSAVRCEHEQVSACIGAIENYLARVEVRYE